MHLLPNPTTVNLMLEALLNDCRILIRVMPNCFVTHIYWEANRCADRMAKMGADLATDFQILYKPPPVVDIDLLFNVIYPVFHQKKKKRENKTL